MLASSIKVKNWLSIKAVLKTLPSSGTSNYIKVKTAL